MPTNNIVLSDRLRTVLDQIVAHPPHALLLAGPTGIGKKHIANAIAAHLLKVDIAVYPYIRTFDVNGGIDMVRDMQRFVALKIPLMEQTVSRILILEAIDRLSIEAQNALLKLLEEPPKATMIILTATSTQSVLPTIRSRVQDVAIDVPPAETYRRFLLDQGYDNTNIDAVFKISGGLPGLTKALLDSDQTHPLYKAVQEARQLLQQSTLQRLAAVDKIAKQKDQTVLVVAMLSRMAQVALEQLAASPGVDQKRLTTWQNILEAADRGEQQLRANSQTKLVLTNLMLSI